VKIAVKYLKKILLFNFKENKKKHHKQKKQRIGKTEQIGKRKLFLKNREKGLPKINLNKENSC